MRRIDYRLIITLVLSIAVVLISALCFTNSYPRLIEGFRDFGLSIAGFFCRMTGVSPTFNFAAVNTPSSIVDTTINVDAVIVESKFVSFGKSFISAQNFVNYLEFLSSGTMVLVYVLMFGVPIVMFLVILMSVLLGGHNNNHGAESLPLRAYKKLEYIFYIVPKRIVKDYIDYLKSYPFILWIWLFITMLSLNVVTVIIEALAYYFYFATTFNVGSIFMQIQKLIADLTVFKEVPIIIWVVVGAYIFLRWRQRVALKRLISREGHNGAFIKNNLKSSGILFAFMGAGKTRFLTDVILTKQKQYREQAREILFEVDSLFPEFPWVQLEDRIREYMRSHVIFNITTVERFAKNKGSELRKYFTDEAYRRNYDKGVAKGKLMPMFNYDADKYGLTRCMGNKIEKLYSVIVDYAKAYFIYLSPSSMIFSNYAISVRGRIIDGGNFPLWAWRFFDEVTEQDEERQNSHIADMDMFRLGKRKKENNENANAFEYGLVAISEADKERGNQFDTNEMKKSDDKANQKNDNFNGFYKMSRQITNIRGRSFFFSLMDMQRLGSINADIKEIGDTIEITDETEEKILVPFFALDELIYNLIVPWFENKYTDFRFRRGDTTLLMYLMKKIACAISRYHKRMYNRFGCIEQKVTVNETVTGKYFIMPMKIYADVYSTDIMASFFRIKASYATKGINDMPTYEGVRATLEELEAQNSYMVDNWIENLSELK